MNPNGLLLLVGLLVGFAAGMVGCSIRRRTDKVYAKNIVAMLTSEPPDMNNAVWLAERIAGMGEGE